MSASRVCWSQTPENSFLGKRSGAAVGVDQRYQQLLWALGQTYQHIGVPCRRPWQLGPVLLDEQKSLATRAPGLSTAERRWGARYGPGSVDRGPVAPPRDARGGTP